jgi:PhnB protein
MGSAFKPPHYPQLMPYLTVKDADKSMQFYCEAFGFTEHQPPMLDNGKIVHASIRLDDCVVMLGAQGAFGSTKTTPITSGAQSPVGFYVYVANVDDFFQNAVANGAKEINAPEEMFWGDKTCCLKDINGYEWTFATFLKKD